MESRVPVPTDNIYKFYALFSLLLFVFSLGSSIWVTRNTNDELLEIAPEISRLEQIERPSQPIEDQKNLLSKRAKIAISDREIFQWSLAVLTGLSVLGMAYGFRKWHSEVQPRQDKLLELQIRLAELQVEEHHAKSHAKKT